EPAITISTLGGVHSTLAESLASQFALQSALICGGVTLPVQLGAFIFTLHSPVHVPEHLPLASTSHDALQEPSHLPEQEPLAPPVHLPSQLPEQAAPFDVLPSHLPSHLPS